jgi:hypothetical protein
MRKARQGIGASRQAMFHGFRQLATTLNSSEPLALTVASRLDKKKRRRRHGATDCFQFPGSVLLCFRNWSMVADVIRSCMVREGI